MVGRRVGESVEVQAEYLTEERLAGSGPQEQRHRRAQLLRVKTAEDLLRAAVLRLGEDACACSQPRAEHGMPQISPGLFQRRDCELSRRLGLPEASDLRKDKPHPVAPLATATQFRGGAGKSAASVLGGHETRQIVRIVHRHLPGALPLPVSRCGPPQATGPTPHHGGCSRPPSASGWSSWSYPPGPAAGGTAGGGHRPAPSWAGPPPAE